MPCLLRKAAGAAALPAVQPSGADRVLQQVVPRARGAA